MKRSIRAGVPIAAILIIIFLSFIYFWTGKSIKTNIKTAKELYPGDAEEALISLLKDKNYSLNGRIHIAIWTLGQLKSEKALPVLYDLYRNDPKGQTCYGQHDSLLCQYEIHKAITSIETGGLFSYNRFKK